MKIKHLTAALIAAQSLSLMPLAAHAWTGDNWFFRSRPQIEKSAADMIDFMWSPANTMTNFMYGSTYHTFYAGNTYRGVAYIQKNPQDSLGEFAWKVANTGGGYTTLGNDCSGFVSMTWALPARYTTWTFEEDAISPGGYVSSIGATGEGYNADLRLGDALNSKSSHIILFKQRTNYGIISMEQTPPVAVRQDWSWSQLWDYRPIRRNGLVEGVAANPVEGLTYKSFSVQAKTALSKVGNNFAFVGMPGGDLMAVKKFGTASKKTEVHILSAGWNYGVYRLQTATPLAETDGNFEYGASANADLVVVKQNGASGTTEVHTLTAASNYQSFGVQTRTALHRTDDSWDFAVMANGDVMAIKKSGSRSGKTEVHILSSASRYQSFRLQTPTALHQTGKDFEFEVLSNGDLVAIKKGVTPSGKTEVHVLSAASNYQQFRLQTPTALHQTDASLAFAARGDGQLMAVKKTGSASGMTEVHVLR